MTITENSSDIFCPARNQICWQHLFFKSCNGFPAQLNTTFWILALSLPFLFSLLWQKSAKVFKVLVHRHVCACTTCLVRVVCLVGVLLSDLQDAWQLSSHSPAALCRWVGLLINKKIRSWEVPFFWVPETLRDHLIAHIVGLCYGKCQLSSTLSSDDMINSW